MALGGSVRVQYTPIRASRIPFATDRIVSLANLYTADFVRQVIQEMQDAYSKVPESPNYQRTENLKRSWRVRTTPSVGGGTTYIIENNAIDAGGQGYRVTRNPRSTAKRRKFYARYVVGTNQAYMHAGKWPRLKDVVEKKKFATGLQARIDALFAAGGV